MHVIKRYQHIDYDNSSEVFRPYDPRAADVAARVREMIQGEVAGARIEHVGSSAIPGCHGKGPVDLLISYTPGQLEALRTGLEALGFQRQTGIDPFPDERPLYLGMIEHDGDAFRLHVHVIPASSPEVAEQLGFRDRLREDPALVESYVALKRSIAEGDIDDNVDYNRKKEAFIKDVIARVSSGD